jgi:hypothetical protein
MYHQGKIQADTCETIGRLKEFSTVTSRPVRNGAGRFKLTAGEESVWKPLEPNADDWLSSGVENPNHLRILFGVREEEQ